MASTRMWAVVVAAGAGVRRGGGGGAAPFHIAAGGARVHVAIEVVAAFISLLGGQLILGRYARSTQLADLLLGAALTLLAFGNLTLSAVPAVLAQEGGALATWGALLVRTI